MTTIILIIICSWVLGIAFTTYEYVSYRRNLLKREKNFLQHRAEQEKIKNKKIALKYKNVK